MNNNRSLLSLSAIKYIAVGIRRILRSNNQHRFGLILIIIKKNISTSHRFQWRPGLMTWRTRNYWIWFPFSRGSAAWRTSTPCYATAITRTIRCPRKRCRAIRARRDRVHWPPPSPVWTLASQPVLSLNAPSGGSSEDCCTRLTRYAATDGHEAPSHLVDPRKNPLRSAGAECLIS